MTLTQIQAIIRKYRSYVAFAALAVFAAIVVGVIFYIRQAQQPLAPTAPTSKPQASENQCTTGFAVDLVCTDIQTTTTLQKGLEVQFECFSNDSDVEYVFQARESEDGDYTLISAEDGGSISQPVTVGDYLEVRCRPQKGYFIASDANIEQDCRIVYQAPEVNEVACLDLQTNGTLEEGQSVSFDCQAANADSYTFEYKDTSQGAFQALGTSTSSSQSAQLTVGEYLEARCIPCQGTNCAAAAEVEQNCTVEYEAPPEEEEVACTSISSSPPLAEGVAANITCAQVEGADSYRFEYRDSATGSYQLLSEGPANNATSTLTVGEYVDVRCTPCAGGTCAPFISACTLNFEAEEEETPVTPQCDSECVNNADCPSNLICSEGSCRNEACTTESDCSCEEEEEEEESSQAGFVIEKYHDLDGDGRRDSGEPGLDWEFRWDRNEDENWRDYVTYADQDGRGGNIDNLEPDDKIRIEEKSKSGWKATTDDDTTLTLKEGKRLLAQFGNWQPPKDSPTPTPTPQPTTSAPAATPAPTPVPQPVSGSTSQTMAVLGASLAIILLGAYQLYLRGR